MQNETNLSKKLIDIIITIIKEYHDQFFPQKSIQKDVFNNC